MIEIGTKYLKFIVIKSASGACEIFDAKALDITHKSRAEIVAYIKSSVRSLGIRKYILCIPRSSAIVRNLDLPSHDLQEVSQMIDLHIEKQVPHSREEIIFAWDFLGVDEGGFGKVILGIIQKETIENLFSVLEEAGVYVNKACLGTLGVIHWILKNIKGGTFAPNKNHIALNIDREETELIVFAGDKILFSRVINIGSLQMTEGTAMMNRLLGEIRQSFLLIPDLNVDKQNVKVYCTGAAEIMGTLSRYLQTELQVDTENIVVAQKLTVRHLSGKPDDNPLNKFSYTALVGIHLALNDDAKVLSFTLPEMAIRTSIRESAHQIIILGGIMVYIIAVVAGVFAENIYLKKNYLEAVTGNMKEISKNYGELDEMFNKMEIARSFLDADKSLLSYLYQFHKVVPEDVSFTTLDIDSTQINVKGIAKTSDAVFKFTTDLEESPYFENVETKYTRKKVTAEEELTEFAVICKLEYKEKNAADKTQKTDAKKQKPAPKKQKSEDRES